MSAPNQTPAANTPAAGKGFVVAPGRTVSVDGKKYGPGDPVKLSAEDAKYLQAAGFVVPAGAKQESGAGATVGGLRIQGGRPPGSRVV